MPLYQINAVKQFINLSLEMNQLPDQSLWNQTGRGYPDISAQAYNINIMVDNILFDYSGTESSVSIIGGIFSLLNDLRFINNQSSLGWLNPFIYQIVLNDTLVFNDITCDCPNNNCDGNGAFHAIKGWDAVTGWGSPNFKILSKYVIN